MFTLMLLLVSNWCINLSPPATLPLSPTTPFPVPPSPNEISLVPNPIPIGPTSITYWHFTVGFRLSSHRGRYHILLGLLLSGQIEINPGPRAPKYPCGECGKGVRWGKSIACDECDTWFHKDCLQMTSINFAASENISWICCRCALPNSSSLFDSFSSTLSASPGQPTHHSSPVAPKRKKSSIKRLKVQVVNFDSMYAKKDILASNLHNENIDIIIGAETHLDGNLLNSEILPPNYTAIRNDRNRSGGGVAIIHKIDLQVTEIRRPKNVELVAAKVQCHGKKPLIICAVYRPPNNNREYMDTLCATIRDIYNSHPGCAFWCGGDFNLPDIYWPDETISGSQYPKYINQALLDLLRSCNLDQIVDFPTRINNTLEIMLTNRPTLVHKITPYPGLSDHDSIVQSEIDCNAQIRRPIPRKIHLWHKLSDSDLSNIQNYVRDQTKSLTENYSPDSPVEELWLKIKQISDHVLQNFVPSMMTSPRFSLPWIDRKCKRLSKRKQRAYNKARRTDLDSDWQKFRNLRRDTQKACKLASANFLAKRISDDFDNNRKTLYKCIKTKRTDNTGVAPLTQNGTTFSSPKDKANVLNKQFASVFSPILDHIPFLGSPKVPKIQDIVITVSGVIKLLKDLKPNKAPGPDDVPAKFLKETASEIAPALTLLFQASLKQSKIPSDWRHAKVAPLYKTGKNDRSKPANYRPISLTSLVCKSMEHIICSNLMGHLDKYNILTDFQHGFRKGRSCETQLILTVGELTRALEQGKQVDCILLDFAKAFDKVSHRCLLAKLKHYGIDGTILFWIEDFLKSRTQVVVVDGEESDVAPVTSGVPQGTVLGPALFLVYINDLPEGLVCTPRLFADDCLLYKVIDSDSDSRLLQRDLQLLESWERTWAMEFAEDKCQVLTVTRKRKIITYDYKIHNYSLERVTSAKYLGLNLDSKLNFNVHINSICKKAHSTRQFLQRTLSRCDIRAKAQAYTTFVRPIVEYSASVWDPHRRSQDSVDQLESVQNKAARFACADWRWTSSVGAMRGKLGWDTLQERRARARLIMFHKITNSLVAIPVSFFPCNTSATMTTRGAPNKFLTPHGSKAFQNSFVGAAPSMWNLLPANIAGITDPEAFRRSISAVGFTA